MAFSKEQLLLLNNLIYEVSQDEFITGNKPRTVADLIGNQRFSELAEGKNVPDMSTSRDWKNLIQAVKNDPKLMNLRIQECHLDFAKGGGGGKSMVLTDESTKEAIVLFQGTATEEWKDDFIGGNVADTQQQENALAWYREACEKYNLDQYDVTVTGHSKGGNKSKYITVMDDSVDHCVSFDGQGFSDKFMDKYSDRIAERQDIIENHNVDYDYVNLLLNDIGETTYYKGQDVGDGGGNFLENHHPVSFFKWDDENGGFSLEECPDGQPAEMKAVDEFFNSCLRSLPDQDRDKMLLMIYNMVMCGFSLKSNDTEKVMAELNDMLNDPETRESLPYLLAYFVRYERENPEVARLIREFLKKSGREDLCKIVDVIKQILDEGIKIEIDLPFNNKIPITITFEQLVDLLGKAGGVVLFGNWISGGKILEKARQAIKDKTGLDLTEENLEGILQMIPAVREDMDKIRVEKDGSDRKIPSKNSGASKKPAGSSSGGHHQFRVDPEIIRSVLTMFSALVSDLHQSAEEISGAGEKIRFMTANTPAIRAATARAAENMGKIESRTKKMSGSLDEILKLYETTERGLCG